MKSRGLNRNMLWLLAAAVLMGGCSAKSSEPAAEGSGSDGQVVLRIDDETYTLDQLDEKGMAHSMKPYQDLYEYRRQAMDQLIADSLFEREAAARGISREDFVRQEIIEKGSNIADNDVSAFYEQNKTQMGLPDELDDNLRVQIRTYLGQERIAAARQQLLTDLRSKSSITISLEPPRVDLAIAPTEPSKGPADAPVTIVEYSDFQCPYCARVGPTLERIAETYPDQVRIVFRDFPLPMHPQAQSAAEAAKCAQEQGQFWPYHDKLFASQKDLSVQSYKKYAEQLGLDTARFAACVDEGRYRQDVLIAQQGGQQFGVSGTPSFFVNGRFLSGAIPFERFQAVIEEELAGTKQPAS